MSQMSHHRRGCASGADLSHLAPKPELRSVIEDPRCDDDLLRAPDADAFGASYARHARAIEVFFAQRTGDRALACDLTGETFAAALIARRRFRAGGAPARAWLYTIASRRLADHRRRVAAEDRLHARLMAHRRTDPGKTRRPQTRRAPTERWRCSSGCHPSSARRSPPTSSPGTPIATSPVTPASPRPACASASRAGSATMRRPAQVRLAAERVLEGGFTYSFGAGHDVPLAACAPSRGLDCSSFASLALRRAGLLASEQALSSWRSPSTGHRWRGRPHHRLGRRGPRVARVQARRRARRAPSGRARRDRMAHAGGGARAPREQLVPRHWPGL